MSLGVAVAVKLGVALQPAEARRDRAGCHLAEIQRAVVHGCPCPLRPLPAVQSNSTSCHLKGSWSFMCHDPPSTSWIRLCSPCAHMIKIADGSRRAHEPEYQLS